MLSLFARESSGSVDRLTLIFWSMIGLLLGVSAFYGVSAVRQRQQLHSSSATQLQSGDLVKLVQLIDGDSLQVAKGNEDPVILRLVGIKAFDAKVEKDVFSPYARTALEHMQRHLRDKPLRVQIDPSHPHDKYERWLATVYVENQDFGLYLIRQGLVLTYPVYPFPALQMYLQAQEEAQRRHLGVWSNPRAAGRAKALMREWQSRTE